jgi:hypothetical protein
VKLTVPQLIKKYQHFTDIASINKYCTWNSKSFILKFKLIWKMYKYPFSHISVTFRIKKTLCLPDKSEQSTSDTCTLMGQDFLYSKYQQDDRDYDN